MLSYLTTAFSLIVFAPVTAILYLTITKKLRLRPVLYGAMCFVCVSVLQQLIYIAVGSFISSNAAAVVTLQSAVSICDAIFILLLIYGKLLQNEASFRDSLGCGVGMASLWVICTVGKTLFFSMMVGVMITDGDTTGMDAEALSAFDAVKQQYINTGLSDYILLTVSGIAMFAVFTAVSVLLFEYNKSKDRKLLIYAAVSLMMTYPLFFLAESGGVNVYLQIFMAAAAIAAIVYIVHESKKYPSALEVPFVRVSPLEGRDFTRRIKRRK